MPALGEDQGGTPKVRNILFLVIDDLKADALGCYGNSVVKTPNIDRLAKQGMVFDRAYCQSTWCLPSRRSFMHGRYTDTAAITMGEHFQNYGIHSARVGKIFHMRVPGDIIAGTDGNDVSKCWNERFNCQGEEASTPGPYACLSLDIFTDKLKGRQSTQDPHRMFVTVKSEGDGSDQPDHKAATKTIELLRKHKDKPFFIATGLIRPHYPNVAPKSYFDTYPWKDMQVPHVPENDVDDIPKVGRSSTTNDNNPIGKHPDNQKRMWAGYLATVTFMDEQVGRILDELDRLGLRDSTAVVLFSDHGYMLGEHTFWQKRILHEEVIKVPLIVDVPNMQAGRTAAITELIDLYPSLSELYGIPSPAKIQGQSFVPVLKDPKATVKESAISIDKGTVLRTQQYAYMVYRNGQEELYDMHKDPKQFSNLTDDPSHKPTLHQLRTQLAKRLQSSDLKSKTQRKRIAK